MQQLIGEHTKPVVVEHFQALTRDCLDKMIQDANYKRNAVNQDALEY